MSRVYEDFDPSFATICSDVTLYSNNKGFFKNMAEDLVSLADKNGWLQTLENVKDNEKIRTVLENETVSCKSVVFIKQTLKAYHFIAAT